MHNSSERKEEADRCLTANETIEKERTGLGALVPAAGFSSRMGAFKPLLPIHGRPMIAWTLDGLFQAGVKKVVVVTGHHREELEDYLNRFYVIGNMSAKADGIWIARQSKSRGNKGFGELEGTCSLTSADQRVETVYNPDYQNGSILTSIQCGITHLSDCSAFFLLLADLPAVSQTTFQGLIRCKSESKKAIVLPTVAGKRRHPPLIATGMTEQILAHTGSGGLREFWKTVEHEIAEYAADDPGCELDADTPQALARVREYMQERIS